MLFYFSGMPVHKCEREYMGLVTEMLNRYWNILKRGEVDLRP